MEKAGKQPDLILLDINMPDIDGIEVCQRIRDFVSCPILFLTARIEEQDKLNGFAVGGDDYIVKPFSIDELGARVEAHLRCEERRHNKQVRTKFDDDLVIDYTAKMDITQVSKNYADMLPIRVQSEEAFSGHMLISFIATAIMQRLQQELLKKRSKKAKSLNAESIFGYLRNQKCKVYTGYAIPQEPTKEANAIYDIFKIRVPHKIPLTAIEV